MNTPEPDAPEPGPGASVDDIHADIEATRAELGQTVEALTAKLDVKAQAHQKIDDTKELIADKADTVRSKGAEVGSQVVDVTTNEDGSVRAVVPAAAVALVAILVGIVIWRRRR